MSCVATDVMLLWKCMPSLHYVKAVSTYAMPAFAALHALH